MASGHVNRIKRPNTWLHRPMLQNREESSCQTGAVHTWHKASIGSVRAYVCSWGCTGNGRATVKLALLTQLGNENKYYGTDQLGSAIFLAHALLPRDEI